MMVFAKKGREIRRDRVRQFLQLRGRRAFDQPAILCERRQFELAQAPCEPPINQFALRLRQRNTRARVYQLAQALELRVSEFEFVREIERPCTHGSCGPGSADRVDCKQLDGPLRFRVGIEPAVVDSFNQARKKRALLGHAEGANLRISQRSPGFRRIRVLRISQLCAQRTQRIGYVGEPLRGAVVSLNRNDDGLHRPAHAVAGRRLRRGGARRPRTQHISERGKQLTSRQVVAGQALVDLGGRPIQPGTALFHRDPGRPAIAPGATRRPQQCSPRRCQAAA